MKRILLSLILLFSLTVAVAQTSVDVNQAIVALNEKCPASAGPGLTLTEIELTPNGAVLHFEINEQNLSIESLESQKDMLHDVYVSEIISSTNPNMQALRSYSVQSSKPLTYRFVGAITDESFDIILQPSEIK